MIRCRSETASIPSAQYRLRRRGARLPSASVRFTCKAVNPKGQGNGIHIAPFAHQPGECFTARHFDRIKPGDVLDQRGLERRYMVARLDRRAGQVLDAAALIRDHKRGMVTLVASENFIGGVSTGAKRGLTQILSTSDHASAIILDLSRSILARPYISRLMAFKRSTLPST